MGTASDLLLCERDQTGDRVRVGVSGLQASWELNAPGALSCRVPLADLRAAGLPPDLRGWWVRWEHPSCGAWGGVVQQQSLQDGVLEIAAASFAVLARKRLVTLRGLVDNVGAVFLKCLKLAEQRTPKTGLVVLDDNIAAGTFLVGTDFVNADLYDEVIPLLTEQAGCVWSVDADRVVRFAQQASLSATEPAATLSEGVEVATARWVDDVTTVSNSIVVIGQELASGQSSNVQPRNLTPEKRQDTASMERYGRLEERITFDPFTKQGWLKTWADARIAELADPSASVTLTVADTAGAWDAVREGTVLRLRLGLSGIDGKMRVASRAVDPQAGTLVVSGPAVRLA